MPATGVVRLLDRELLVFRRIWYASAFSALVMPLLFLVAMGVGLGGIVDDRPGDVEGLSYLHFVAPGLMVASAMQLAAGESLWPVLGGLKWDGRFIAMVATPMTPSDVLDGLLAWIGLRVAASTTAFLSVAALLGGIPSWWGLVALPVTVLCALAFAAPLAAYAAAQDSDAPFSVIMRLGVIPLFLFSGTFFPVANLPGWAQPLSWLSPLWHGVEVARDATTGAFRLVDAVHLLVLALIVAAGHGAGRRSFTRRLTP